MREDVRASIITKHVLDRDAKKPRLPYLHRSLEAIIEELAVKYDVPVVEVRKIITAPFRLFRDIRSDPDDFLSDNTFPIWNILHLGRWVPRKHRLKTYRENREKDRIEKEKESEQNV